MSLFARNGSLILVFNLFALICCAQVLQFEDRQQIPRSSAEVGVGDFDHDGHVDIAICNSDQRWYAGPDFTTWYQIGVSEGGPYGARVADINDDGWDDFVTSDGTRTQADVDEMDGELYVYINPGGSGGDPKGTWDRIVIYSGNVRHQNDIRIADMDGDGRLDVIERTWSSERVVVSMQNADINNWTTRVFDTGETGQPEGISAGDVDGDGEMEIVLSGVYWDNPGGWRTGNPIEHLIDTEFVQEEVKSAVGDIDGDGDNDIYMGSAEKTYRFLAWYEHDSINPNTGGVVFIKHLIEDDIGNCHMIELVDIDKDNDLDLCTSQSFSDSGCLIYYNNGDGSSWTKQDYDPDGKLYTGVVRDLDKDGDLDIVGPSGFYSTVYYYINITPGSPPEAPGNLSAALLNGTDVALTWDDLSNNEGKFEIERFESGSWSALTTTATDEVSYLDTLTTAGTTYSYRIFASNFAGNSDTITSSVIVTWPSAGQVLIQPTSGNFLSSPTITLSAMQPYDEIVYTTDGTLPNEQSNLYSGSFILDMSATVKAMSIGNELINSPISEASYQIAIDGNFPPIANAGEDEIYLSFANISLDGSASVDIDDQESLSYLWTQISGPPIMINSNDAIIADFTPTEVGIYEFELEVADEVLSDKDTILIEVKDLSKNLIAYWPLDDEDGNATEVVNGNDAISSSGINYLPMGGQVDGAFSFDGGAFTRLLAPNINISNDSMTITLWLKADNLSSVEGRLISKANGANANDHNWMLSLNGGSALRFRLKTDESNNTTTLISDLNEIVPDVWYFVAARYDGQTMQLFKDKIEIKSTAKTGNIIDASFPVAIGNQPTTVADRPIPGLIDDVRIFDKALSNEELADLYDEACVNFVSFENFAFSENTTLLSGDLIELKNITINEGVELILKSQSTRLLESIELKINSQLRLIKENGCE